MINMNKNTKTQNFPLCEQNQKLITCERFGILRVKIRHHVRFKFLWSKHTRTLLGPISKNTVAKEAEHVFPVF